MGPNYLGPIFGLLGQVVRIILVLIVQVIYIVFKTTILVAWALFIGIVSNLFAGIRRV